MIQFVAAISIPIPWPLIVLAVVIAVAGVIAALLKSPTVKGKMGEFAVDLGSKLFLDTNEYHVLKDVTLPAGDGTTQIDHVIVSRYGVFVVETKNRNGAIYGGEHQRQWTAP